MKSDTWDINELLETLREESEAREKSGFVGGSSSVVEKPWSKQNKSPEPITAGALHLSEQVKRDCYFSEGVICRLQVARCRLEFEKGLKPQLNGLQIFPSP